MPFVAYVDESGEAGIKVVREGDKPGASPYFVLAAAVMQPATEIRARKLLAEIRDRIGKKTWKHATELDHSAKVYFARELSSLHVRFFAVVSNKSTLGEYKEQIDGSPDKFYNKCLKYLLERVCSYLTGINVSEDEFRVVLERRNHDYDAMHRYFNKVRSNPLYEQSESLGILNPFAISAMGKGEEELLQVADLVAHAVYQCTNRTKANFDIPEYRYFDELSSRFAADASGLVLGTGLKCIHSLEMLRLDPRVEELFRKARAKPPGRGRMG